MEFALINGRILTEAGIVEGNGVLVEDGRVRAIIPQDQLPVHIAKTDLKGALLAPGFIDIQVNGGGGVLFNDAPTVDTIARIGRAHRQFGTTGFFPTLISDDLDNIENAIKAVDDAIAKGVPGVLGIHLEGPFLNAAKKGIHDSEKFLTLSPKHIKLLTSLKRGKTLITLAPENTTPEILGALVEAGAIISAGHTNATYTQMHDALANGVTGFTHLFNAMTPMESREPGVVGAALEDQKSWCGIIVDGRHVSPITLKIALRCKPLSQFILVTDAMPTVGHHEDFFMLQGKKITVKDGVCQSADGTLAGSHLNMAQAVSNTISLLNIAPEDALNMASRNAANFMGLGVTLGTIKPGQVASFVALNGQFEVERVWINGEIS
ncbi:MAG: N-acetylglucosamine-6-phosphate deacetylase [Robiginitomaculum sp.]